MSHGFTFPLRPATGSLGFFEATDDVWRAVENDMRSLVLTNRGERVVHYDYGCDLRSLLFEQMPDDERRGRIVDSVLSQIKRWMPFVVVEGVDVITPDDDSALCDNGLRIRISYRISGAPQQLRMAEVDARGPER